MMKLHLTIFTIILFIVSLLIPINIFALNFHWYTNEFQVIGVYNQVPKERVNSQLENLLGYITNDQELNNSFYTEKEILHLKDIKKIIAIIKISMIITIISIILLIIYSLVNKILQKTLFIASLGALIIYAILGSIIYFQFDVVFLKFHQIIFSNDYWMLNPDIDKLIEIFPPKLFFDLALDILTVSVLSLIIINLTSKLFRKVNR